MNTTPFFSRSDLHRLRYTVNQSDPVPQCIIMLWKSFYAFNETKVRGSIPGRVVNFHLKI